MRISLKDFGGFLSSPELGKRIAISVLDSIRKEPDLNVILDFSGVHGANRHFVEEFFNMVLRGIGYDEFKKKVILQNQSAVVKMVFDSVVNQKKDIAVEGIDAVIGEPIHTVQLEKKEEVSTEVKQEEDRIEESDKEVDVKIQPESIKEEKAEIESESEAIEKAEPEEEIEEKKVVRKRKTASKKDEKEKSSAKKSSGKRESSSTEKEKKVDKKPQRARASTGKTTSKKK